MTDFEQFLVPLFEYLGIPLIILTPLALILYIIFKYVIPKLMNNNSRLVGQIVMDIVANLFGEGNDDSIITGLDELEASKVIKMLPKIVDEKIEGNNELLYEVITLFVLLSQAMMDERFIKPNNSEKLQRVVKHGNKLIMLADLAKKEKEELLASKEGVLNEENTETNI